MSHEIETMFSVREKPWHWAETKEVTKLIQQAPTSAEALHLMLRKDLSALQNSVNRLQDQKKRLEGVVSDLIGCSKRLMNMK